MTGRELIARRVALEFGKGQTINLGIGIPTLVAGYINPADGIMLQSENGIWGMQSLGEGEAANPDITDSGGRCVKAIPGGTYFSSADSFAMIRGGHVDHTVLGALQVDQTGSLASWMVPGKLVTGMGGAMDLVVGANNVIVAMEHLNKKGEPKIVCECSLPLTAVGVVRKIITDMAVIEVTGQGLALRELAPGVDVETVRQATGAPLQVEGHIPAMAIV